jgi:hypothetical protein
VGDIMQVGGEMQKRKAMGRGEEETAGDENAGRGAEDGVS